jgi:hypothetical protein
MKHAKWMIAAILMALPALASAQLGSIDHLVVNVPFDFTVGDAHVPAGQCIVTRALRDSSLLMIENVSAKRSASFLVTPEETKGNEEGYSLIFNKYGEHYFLSAIRVEGRTIDRLPESKLETELQTQNGRAIEVVASLK